MHTNYVVRRSSNRNFGLSRCRCKLSIRPVEAIKGWIVWEIYKLVRGWILRKRYSLNAVGRAFEYHLVESVSNPGLTSRVEIAVVFFLNFAFQIKDYSPAVYECLEEIGSCNQRLVRRGGPAAGRREPRGPAQNIHVPRRSGSKRKRRRLADDLAGFAYDPQRTPVT
jgi:hypothetical protein